MNRSSKDFSPIFFPLVYSVFFYRTLNFWTLCMRSTANNSEHHNSSCSNPLLATPFCSLHLLLSFAPLHHPFVSCSSTLVICLWLLGFLFFFCDCLVTTNNATFPLPIGFCLSEWFLPTHCHRSPLLPSPPLECHAKCDGIAQSGGGRSLQ